VSGESDIPGFTVLSRVGPQGQVLIAQDLSSGQRVALKAFPASPNGGRQFQKELALLSSLDHRNIVRFQGLVYGSRGRHYLALELADAGSLRDHLLERERFCEREALQVIRDICQGLEVAHRHGIVHRDLKPENVLCFQSPTDQAALYKVADLGIAHVLGDYSANLTGSPAYMAPEQFYDQPTVASDLYAVGVILFELLVGDPPFLGSHQELCVAHGQTRPDFSLLPSVRCLTLLESLLAKKPTYRPSSARAVAEACRALLDESVADASVAVAPSPPVVSMRLKRLVRQEVPGAALLFCPFLDRDQSWLAGRTTTDLVRQGRYHPAFLSHAVRAAAAAHDANLPCFYATRDALFRIGCDQTHPVRLSQQPNGYHTLASDSHRLFLLDRTRLECVDHCGIRLWHFPCSSFALRTRLALYGNKTLLLTTSGARNAVLCLCRESGSLLWSQDLPGLPCALAASPQHSLYDVYFIDPNGPRLQIRRRRMRQSQTIEQMNLPPAVTAVRGYPFGASLLNGNRIELHDFQKGQLGSFSLGGQWRAECWNPTLNSYSWIETAQGRTYLTQVEYPTPSGLERSSGCNSSFISSATRATA
jgi:serine/threonine-protein kinase